MEIISYEDDVKEILIEDLLKTNDNGKVINPKESDSRERRPELVKEIIAYDAIDTTIRQAGALHGVSKNAADHYSNGESIKDENARARILSYKNNIADIAITKLMDSLNLIDPTSFEKQKDIVDAASKLAGIVERVTTKDNRGGDSQVHLYLMGVKQNPISKYDVIDV